jgi:hypothetical protein
MFVNYFIRLFSSELANIIRKLNLFPFSFLFMVDAFSLLMTINKCFHSSDSRVCMGVASVAIYDAKSFSTFVGKTFLVEFT